MMRQGGVIVTATATALGLLAAGCVGQLNDAATSAASSSAGLSAPTTVIATEGNGRNLVKWQPLSGATAYTLLASTTPILTAANGTLISTTRLTSVVETGLTNDVTRYYAVFALTSAGQTPLSTLVSAAPTSVCAGGQTGTLPSVDSSLYSLLRRIDGKAAGDAFGSSVSMLSSWIVIGAPSASPSGVSGAGSAFVCSGSDGRLMFRFDGEAVNDGFGRSVALVSDLTGDGTAEILVGAAGASPGGKTNAGSAFVFSGADGSRLFRFDGETAGDNFGAIVGTGDVDGDGKSDFVIGAPQAGGTLYLGRVYVFSGADGSLIFKKDGDLTNGNAASCLGVPGDLNGDGKAEVAISSATTSPSAGSSAGSAWIIKGAAKGSALAAASLADSLVSARIDGRLAGDWFGQFTGAPGDVNSDGIPDLIIGAPAVSASPKRAGTARVFSGATGAELFSLQGETAGDEFGFSGSKAGTVSGDPRLLVGAPKAAPGGRTKAGKISVFSGSGAHALLFSFEGESAGDALGSPFTSLSGGGDADGNGKPDIAAGAPGAAPGGKTAAGRVYLFGAK